MEEKGSSGNGSGENWGGSLGFLIVGLLLAFLTDYTIFQKNLTEIVVC